MQARPSASLECVCCGAIACYYPLPDKDYVLQNEVLLDELQEAVEAFGWEHVAVAWTQAWLATCQVPLKPTTTAFCSGSKKKAGTWLGLDHASPFP